MTAATDNFTIEVYEKNGKTVKLMYDPYPMNPREEFDNLGQIMYSSRSRYILGDLPIDSFDEMEEIMDSDDYIWLPVYAYIHGGVVLNTSGFSCPWDSGQSGIIYANKDDIRQWFGIKRITKKVEERVHSVFRGEIDTFSAYLGGQVYGYVVEENGEHIDSCFGFYDLDDCKKEAENMIS